MLTTSYQNRPQPYDQETITAAQQQPTSVYTPEHRYPQVPLFHHNVQQFDI